MIRYIQVKAPQGDHRAIMLSKRIKLDLIEVPDEFKDISIEDLETKKRRSKKILIRNRTNTDISNYDAWRVHDRFLMKTGGKQPCTRVLELSPALLVKAFGMPAFTKMGFAGSGDYDFEDLNFDVFNLADYKQTD
jgi:hypothetical protein